MIKKIINKNKGVLLFYPVKSKILRSYFCQKIKKYRIRFLYTRIRCFFLMNLQYQIKFLPKDLFHFDSVNFGFFRFWQSECQNAVSSFGTDVFCIDFIGQLKFPLERNELAVPAQ